MAVAPDPPVDPGATPIGARNLAPDLARGAMLLLIALANVHVYVYGRPTGVRGYPRDLSAVDRVVAAVQLMLVDGRAYPLFGLLFGYGIVQLARRRTAVGMPVQTVKSLIRRRGWWMLAIGFLHAALLWAGDIVGLYGLIAVLLVGLFLAGTDRALLVTTGISLLLAGLLGLVIGLTPPEQAASLASMTMVDPVGAALTRVFEWLTGAAQACGQRSLSCYLAQSVAFVALLPAWTFGLGGRIELWQAALIGLGTWAVILVIAAWTARAGYRGPAEILLRGWPTDRGVLRGQAVCAGPGSAIEVLLEIGDDPTLRVTCARLVVLGVERQSGPDLPHDPDGPGEEGVPRIRVGHHIMRHPEGVEPGGELVTRPAQGRVASSEAGHDRARARQFGHAAVERRADPVAAGAGQQQREAPAHAEPDRADPLAVHLGPRREPTPGLLQVVQLAALAGGHRAHGARDAQGLDPPPGEQVGHQHDPALRREVDRHPSHLVGHSEYLVDQQQCGTRTIGSVRDGEDTGQGGAVGRLECDLGQHPTKSRRDHRAPRLPCRGRLCRAVALSRPVAAGRAPPARWSPPAGPRAW